MKISAVIITFNEERNIARCIDSLDGVADEVIVVDSYSTDKTQKICEDKGVMFTQRTWDDYSAQKNYANSLAQFDYILSIDSDEALSEELKESIKEIKSGTLVEGYTVNRLTNYCGRWIKHCGWYPDKKLRLWKNEAATWTGTIHETLSHKMSGIGHLHGDLLHYSYYSIAQHVGQINRFTDLQAEKLFNSGKSPSMLKTWFSPPFKFFQKYIIQGGFLDGREGYIISRMAAYYVFLKYVKHRQLVNSSRLRSK
jgi:glycosyltransferase involved in cell wall biosynthesis